MKGRFLLSPLALTAFVSLVGAADLIIGTSLDFVCMAMIALLCACLTYNMLGGLGTIAGIGFSSFAMGAVVIGQLGKVVLLERADQNLYVPQLTITVYAVFFLSLMLGTLMFGRLRLPLPRPAEPTTQAQGRSLYILALSGGLIGTFTLTALNLKGETAAVGLAHGFARALAYLLPLSIVVAVDDRIRSTAGRHCFGWRGAIPAIAMVFLSFAENGRSMFVQPFLVIFLAAFLRGFRFGKKHVLGGIALIVLLFVFVSPFYVWARAWRDKPTIWEQASSAWRLLQEAPSEWSTITYDVGAGGEVATGAGDAAYFPLAGAVTLNRIVLIAKDSTLISACASGFHYGFESLKLDLLSQVPRFLYPSKPEIGSNEFLGHLDGQESDDFDTTFSTVTSISDSFGAFSWAGVVFFAFFVMPAIFVVYESMFDITRPWGTAAAASLIMVGAAPMGNVIATTLVKNPLYFLIISWSVGATFKMIPSTGDRSVGVRSLARNAAPVGVRPPSPVQ